MSTNYYLDSPDNEAGHIGQWAAGRFTARATDGVSSFADWTERLRGHRIFAEHGMEYTLDEMVAIALEHSPHAHVRSPRDDDVEFMDRGVLFVRYDFC